MGVPEGGDLPRRMREVVEQACRTYPLDDVTGETREAMRVVLTPSNLHFVQREVVISGEPVSQALEDLKIGFRGRLIEAIDPVVYGEIDAICAAHSDSESRRIALQACLTNCLNAGFEVFWGGLESLVRQPFPFDPKNPLEFLRRNEDLSLAFIHTVQQDPSALQQHAHIRDYCSRSDSPPSGNRFFRGASIAPVPPLFETFGRLCGEPSATMHVFAPLMNALNQIVEKATQGRQRAYPISSARDGWFAFLDQCKRIAPFFRVYSTTTDHLPMLGHRHSKLIVEDHDDDTLLKSLIAAIQKDTSAEGFNPETQPRVRPIIFLTSVLRTGRRRDVDRIIREVRAVCSEAMVVVDAAQDHFFYPDADAVLYSKHVGGAGMGLLMLAINGRVGHDFHDNFRVTGSQNTAQLAKAVAALRCEQQPVHFANQLGELCAKPSLWHFSGRGTYIDRQANRLKDMVEQHLVLNRHFQVEFFEEPSNDNNPNPWRASRIVVLRRRSESTLDLPAFAASLSSTYGLQLDCFSLVSFEPFKELQHLMRGRYNRANCAVFFRKLLEFQESAGMENLLEMVTLPDVINGKPPSRSLYKRQRRALREAVQSQTLLRLRLEVTHSEEDIDYLLKSLGAVADFFHLKSWPDAFESVM